MGEVGQEQVVESPPDAAPLRLGQDRELGELERVGQPVRGERRAERAAHGVVVPLPRRAGVAVDEAEEAAGRPVARGEEAEGRARAVGGDGVHEEDRLLAGHGEGRREERQDLSARRVDLPRGPPLEFDRPLGPVPARGLRHRLPPG